MAAAGDGKSRGVPVANAKQGAALVVVLGLPVCVVSVVAEEAVAMLY